MVCQIFVHVFVPETTMKTFIALMLIVLVASAMATPGGQRRDAADQQAAREARNADPYFKADVDVGVDVNSTGGKV